MYLCHQWAARWKHSLAPTAIPIVAWLDNRSDVADPDAAVAVAEFEAALDVLMATNPLLVGEAPLCVVDADTVAGDENVDPGTVGFVSRILKSDSCQRTWMAKARSHQSASVVIHLLYADAVLVRHE